MKALLSNEGDCVALTGKDSFNGTGGSRGYAAIATRIPHSR
jgi:hypothetical protein